MEDMGPWDGPPVLEWPWETLKKFSVSQLYGTFDCTLFLFCFWIKRPLQTALSYRAMKVNELHQIEDVNYYLFIN